MVHITILSSKFNTADENSTANVEIKDVVGNKEDHSFSNYQNHPSVVGHLKAGYYHVHAPAKLYPKFLDAVSVNNNVDGSPAGDWVESDKQEVIPTTAFDKPFDIHWIKIFSMSANDEYVLTLYNSSDEVLGEVGFSQITNQVRNTDVIIQIPPLPANSQVRATLAAKAGSTARSVTVKFFIHEYPDIV